MSTLLIIAKGSLVALALIGLAAIALVGFIVYLGFQEYRDMKLSMQQQDRMTDRQWKRSLKTAVKLGLVDSDGNVIRRAK